MIRTKCCVGLIVLMFLFLTLPAFADELSDLKAKAQRLEEENRQLRLRLQEHGISTDIEESKAPAPVKKSLASLAGVKEKSPLIKGGFIDLNYYFTNEEANTLTLNMLANIGDFQYFQLINMDSLNDAGDTARFDLRNFFTEVHLRHPINKNNEWLKAMDWTIMYSDGTLAKDLIRLGARARLNDLPGPVGHFFREVLGLNYAINFWPYESDGEGSQIEHVYRKELFDGLIYLSGFGDQEIDGTGVYWVSEHQVGLRVIDNFYLIHETRYKTNNARGNKWASAYGLQYVIPF